MHIDSHDMLSKGRLLNPIYYLTNPIKDQIVKEEMRAHGKVSECPIKTLSLGPGKGQKRVLIESIHNPRMARKSVLLLRWPTFIREAEALCHGKGDGQCTGTTTLMSNRRTSHTSAALGVWKAGGVLEDALGVLRPALNKADPI
jgi:hypothetical protein